MGRPTGGRTGHRWAALVAIGAASAVALALLPSSADAAPPDATNDAYTVGSNRTHDLAVLANDTDPDSQPLTITGWAAQSVAGGIVDCSTGLSCQFTSAPNHLGADSFTYTVDDGAGGTDTATVSLTVADDPPTVNPDTAVARPGQPTPVNVLANDFDPNGSPVVVTTTTTTSGLGGAVACTSASCTYTAAPGVTTGTDTFTYAVADGGGLTGSATVTVTVRANQLPVANADLLTGARGLTIDIPVLANDVDPDGSSLVVTASVPSANGSTVDCVVVAPACRYTPAPGFTGIDGFNYTIADADGATATGGVLILLSAYATIGDGTVQLGVADTGRLEQPVGGPGLVHLPSGAGGVGLTCTCEGWGVADATSGATGYTGGSTGAAGLTVQSFTSTATTATSTTLAANRLRVTHQFRPSAVTGLYEVVVTIQNVGTTTADVRYRRVVDWSVAPTPGQELVTIEAGSNPRVTFTSDDGIASANPLAGPSQALFAGEAVDSGPADHGVLVDLGLGAVPAGGTTSFRLYLGAAGSEGAALSALQAVGAEAFSLAQSTAGGTPATFSLGLAGMGGGAPSAFPAVEAGGPYTVAEGASVLLGGTATTGSGRPLTTTWTPSGRFTNGSSLAPTFAGIDDEQLVVTLTACDDLPFCSSDTAQVTTTNVAPTANAGPDRSGSSGQPVTLAVSFTDPGAADTHTVQVAWGDGTTDTITGATSPLSPPHTYAASGRYTATVTVTDDDGGSSVDTAIVQIDPVPVLTPVSVSVAEGNLAAENVVGIVSVLLSAPSATPVTVQYASAVFSGAPAPQATPGEDYVPVSGTITFAPFQTVATVPVPIVEDVRYEANDYVLVQFGNATGATVGGFFGLASVTITNDDPLPVVSVGNPSVLEGSGTAVRSLAFPVTLSAPSGVVTRVTWATLDPTGLPGFPATPTADYVVSGATLTFQPGETSKIARVNIVSDTIDEPDEYVVVRLTNPVNAVLGTSQGTGTIRDDD